MREDTKRKLDALARGERRSLWLAAGFGAAATIAFAYWVIPPGETHQVRATVQQAFVGTDTLTGQRQMSIRAQLDNGKIIGASGYWAILPERGSKIVLTEHEGRLGFHDYSWHGIVAKGEMPPRVGGGN